MKKLLVVVTATAALLFGGAAANAASVTVCADVNVNGQGTGGEQCVSTPALP